MRGERLVGDLDGDVRALAVGEEAAEVLVHAGRRHDDEPLGGGGGLGSRSAWRRRRWPWCTLAPAVRRGRIEREPCLDCVPAAPWVIGRWCSRYVQGDPVCLLAEITIRVVEDGPVMACSGEGVSGGDDEVAPWTTPIPCSRMTRTPP